LLFKWEKGVAGRSSVGGSHFGNGFMDIHHHGGDEIFVREVFSRASYSQAEHFLHGDVSLDVNAIVHEVLIVDGKARMYFGLFPAFLRIPLNYIYPSG
jgi:hypothetical protein